MKKIFIILLTILGIFALSSMTIANANCKKNCKKPAKPKIELPKSAKQGTADKVATTPQSALKLRTELAFKEAGILTNDGKLTKKAIANSELVVLSDGVIRNPDVVKVLTKDGSKITDWKKFSTQSILMPNGQSMQIHYYKNVRTGKIDYETKDYKVKDEVKP